MQEAERQDFKRARRRPRRSVHFIKQKRLAEMKEESQVFHVR